MEQTICQSCGMPMAAVEHFGTNGDNSLSKDYCCFCFQKGVFTDNFSFDEFVDDYAGSHNESEKQDGCTVTKDEVELRAKVQLPSLKRWAAHQITHQEYYKSVNRAVDFINEHLAETINLSDLANIANSSEFHFHRIFKAIMNESPGDYIQRLRLEKASFKLQTTRLSLSEIAEQTGYQSPYSLSKAFKKRFGITPSAYRVRPMELNVAIRRPLGYLQPVPEVKVIEPKKVVYVRVVDPFNDCNAFAHAWQRLIRFVDSTGIPDREHEYFCLSRDVSTITRPEYYRIYACVSTSKEIKPKGQFGIQSIEGGLYAIFRHKGMYSGISDLYLSIYRYWIPNSSYELRDTISFEKYLNSPNQVSADELLTEIYVPVKPLE